MFCNVYYIYNTELAGSLVFWRKLKGWKKINKLLVFFKFTFLLALMFLPNPSTTSWMLHKVIFLKWSKAGLNSVFLLFDRLTKPKLKNPVFRVKGDYLHSWTKVCKISMENCLEFVLYGWLRFKKKFTLTTYMT